MMTLLAPFPWFGGKRRVASLVWERFGSVPNYVEPFAGSLAVLLSRPHEPGTESVNDLDGYISNFWRAIQAEPGEVARVADWPVSECDLHARHQWLVGRATFRERMLTDPDYYDVRIAGWWVWGISQWIGGGWCSRPERTGQAAISGSAAARGIHAAGMADRGDWRPSRQLPNLGNAGMGIAGMGILGMGILSRFEALSVRLRRVRVACGSWDRVLGPCVTERHGITGVFLDPPYASGEHTVAYATGDSGDVSADVRAWAIEHGSNPRLRIALCGYEGEHEMPPEWEMVAWKAAGGYGSQGDGKGRENSRRERVWFSPACHSGRQRLLFAPDYTIPAPDHTQPEGARYMSRGTFPKAYDNL